MIRSGYLFKNIIAMVFIFGISGVANAGLIYQVTNKGISAYMAGGYRDSHDRLSVRVLRNGSGTEMTTTLYYDMYKTGEGFKYWYGVIPNSAVTIVGSTISINYNTCETNQVALCGLVKLTWIKNKRYTQHRSGLRRAVYRDLITLENGTSTYESSDVSGSVIGIDLSLLNRLDSEIGNNHKVTFNVRKGP